VTWKNPRVTRLRLCALDVVKLAASPGNFIGGDSLALGSSLGHLCLQCPFRVCQSLTLFEQVLLEVGHLPGVESVD
jgi:hypothetical protein